MLVRKSTIIIFVMSIFVPGLLALYIVASNSREMNLVDILLFTYLVITLAASIAISWEENNYIWFTLLIISWIMLSSGSSISVILSLLMPPLYTFIRFSSMRAFVKKLQK
jgi:hypothetical protein